MGHTRTDQAVAANQEVEGGSRRRILVRAVGDERVASTRFRVLAHLEALRTSGFEIDLELERAPASPLLRWPGRLFDLLKDTARAPNTDVLLLHRRTYPPPFARRLGSLQMPVVLDLDDALYLPPPSSDDSASPRRSYRRNFDATVAAADLVICGNPEIARNVVDAPTEVVPTAIDCDRFSPAAVEPTNSPVIGWVGYSDNLPYLEALADPLSELARRHPKMRLLVVADREPKLEGVPVDFRRWTLDTEVSCFSGMTVGVMPLDDTPWTRAKCSFKLLQYMALGIPAVASPVGMNREVVSDGVNGLLASTPDAWFECLDSLLSDSELSRGLAEAGRRTVVERYSLEVITPRLAEILRNIRSRPRAADRRPGGLR